MKKNIRVVIFYILLFVVGHIQAQTVITSLVELQSHLDDSNGDFVMSPGTYYFDTSNCGTGMLFPDSEILLFTGSNSTFDFTDVKFEFDTEIYAVYTDWSVNFWPTGDNNVYLNLTMENIGNTVPNAGGEAVHLDGADNRIEGFHITVRGSYPYGYGDIFGKGGGSVIGHKKRAGMLVRGDRNHLKNCTLLMRSYGHGIFMQGAEDALIEGCYVEGELRTIAELLEEEGTGSPADNVDFMSVWGYDMRELEQNYRFSLQEDGIRSYTTGLIYGTETSRSTTGTQVKNCTVVKMRSGVTIGWDYTAKVVEDCTVLACETGYWFGSNTTATGCSGDASVGPLVSEDVGRSDSTMEVTILDNYVSKLGDTPYLYFAGDGHNLTLNDGTTTFNDDIELQVGGTRVAHRWLAGSGEEPLYKSGTDLTFTNNTKYPVVLSDNVSTTDVFTCSTLTDNGTGNSTTLLASCDYDRTCDNTAANLQAECYDNMSGIQIENLGSNNEKNIGYIHANDWISFNNIDLTNMSSVEIVAGTNKSGTAVEVRQGSTTGTLLATVSLTSTSSFHTYAAFTANLAQTVNGVVDIYFVFTGGGGYLFNVDTMSFIEDSCAVTSYNPVLPISAESFCDESGTQVENITALNQAVGNINNGDYLRFSNVDFGNDDVYNSVDVLVSSATAGGSVEVRSGSVSGTLLATIPVSNTGGWSAYKSFSAFTTSEITGVHDIYLVFTGDSGYLFNIDNFSFNHDECSGVLYGAFNRLDALSYCGMFGVVPINGEYLGGIQDGDWIRYGAVDFTSTSPSDVTLSLSGLTGTTGFVNIMLDHPEEGILIASATVPETGGWENWQEVNTLLNQTVTGTHEVYVYFGNTNYNLEWFQFNGSSSGTNLALDRNTAQSSVSNNGGSSRAIDGNTNGAWSGGSITHTASELNPWWEVNLGIDQNIGDIVIYNRTDGCCSSRLSDFTVSVIDTDGTTNYTQTITSVPNPSVTVDAGGASGRIVRVQINGTGVLSLAEVEVYVDASSSKITKDDITFEVTEVFNVSPNPANDLLNIVYPNSESLKIEIYSMSGNLVLQKMISNQNNIQLNIEHLSQGLYFLRLTGNEFRKELKLIKE